MIERIRGQARGRNRASAYKDLVWTVATAGDTSADIAGQTRAALATIEQSLTSLGASKQSIVSTQIFLARMADKAAMDAVWCAWIGDDPQHWPQRACVGAALEGGALVEIVVTAVRG